MPTSKSKRTVSNSKRLTPLIFSLIVGLWGAVLYANTLGHGFVFDDFFVIRDNWLVKKGISSIPQLISTPYLYGFSPASNDYYRPFSLVMFAVEWHLSPNNPAIHHTVSVLMYALTGIVLFYTLATILRRYHLILPFVVSLLFIAHPIHTEVVANIKARDILMAFFWSLLAFQCLWLFLRKKGILWLLLSLLSYFFALTCRENAITILAIFPLLLYFFGEVSWRRWFVLSSLYFIPTGFFLFIRATVIGLEGHDPRLFWLMFLVPVVIYGVTRIRTNFPFRIGDRWLWVGIGFLTLTVGGVFCGWAATSVGNFNIRFPSTIVMIGRYLFKLVYPHPLVSDASYNQHPGVLFTHWKAILSSSVLGLMALYAIITAPRKHLPAFGILYFFVLMSLYAYFTLMRSVPYGERFLYASSLGFCLVLGYGMLKLLRYDLTPAPLPGIPVFLRQYAVLWSVLSVILGLYAFKTVTRNLDWKSNATLRSQDVQTSPNSGRMHYYYGLTLMEDKAMEADSETEKIQYLREAIKEFKKATQLDPYLKEPYGQLGVAYMRLGEYKKARKNFEKAIKNALVYNNLGILYYAEGDTVKALQAFEQATRIDPNLANAHFNIGMIRGGQGQYALGIQHLMRAAACDPFNAPTYYNIGLLYRLLGDEPTGNRYLEKAYQLDPSLRPNSP
ncbi:MAG: tetratricopeptide repeat protein [Gemmatimonadetes bacterium]|nr:MAG: tetratricopeptide repeat protein [Gemmatimonadota bacterium]